MGAFMACLNLRLNGELFVLQKRKKCRCEGPHFLNAFLCPQEHLIEALPLCQRLWMCFVLFIPYFPLSSPLIEAQGALLILSEPALESYLNYGTISIRHSYQSIWIKLGIFLHLTCAKNEEEEGEGDWWKLETALLPSWLLWGALKGESKGGKPKCTTPHQHKKHLSRK